VSSMLRRLHFVTAVGLSAGVAGCALIVGDVQGSAVFASDAATHDATTLDARNEATVTHDTGRPDVVDAAARVDARDATTPKDASDATAPTDAADATAPKDATHARDGGEDAMHLDGAKPKDAPVGDGGVDAGYCGNLAQVDGSTIYCEDFDENPNLSSAFAAHVQLVQNGVVHALSVESDASLSSPNAAYAATIPPDGGAAQSYFGLVLPKTGTTYVVDFEVFLTEVPTAGAMVDSQIGGIVFAGDGGNATVLLQVTPGSGGADAYNFNVSEASVTVPNGLAHGSFGAPAGWTHLRLVVGPIAGKLSDELYINGVKREQIVLQSPFGLGHPYGLIGWQYTAGGTERKALFDNLTFIVQE